MKIIRYLLFLIIIALILLFIFFDTAIKNISENYASNTLDTKVNIKELTTNLIDKKLSINQISIKNPAGFNSNNNILQIDNFNFKLNDKTTKELIVIDNISLNGIHALIEQNNNGVNLLILIDMLKNPNNSSVGKAPSDNNSGSRVIINNLSATNNTIKINSKFFNETITVPDLNITDFGGTTGIAINAVGAKLIQAILDNLKQSLSDKGVNLINKKIETTISREISKKLGMKADTLDDIGKNLKDKAKKAEEDIKEKAKNLFKKLGF